MNNEMNSAIDDFVQALLLADPKCEMKRQAIIIDDLGCPHKPKKLQAGKMAVYIFRKDGENAEYLKIGKAGSRSNARFNSQHYGPNRAKNSLAGCLLNDPGMVPYHLDSNNVGNWIRQNIHRIDILIDQKEGIFVLNFLESFLHCKFRPKYEGFKSQTQTVGYVTKNGGVADDLG